MIRKVRRIALWVVFLLALPFVALSALHIPFSLAAHAEIERRGLSDELHNAMKHALAASEFYSAARIAFGPQQAAGAVIRLGEINEWIERYIKHDTDVTPEVYKDLRNNLVGIAAAEWLYAQKGYAWPCTRFRLIGKMAKDGELAAYAEDSRVPGLPPGYDTAAAIARMETDKAALRKKIDADLMAKDSDLRADLQLD